MSSLSSAAAAASALDGRDEINRRVNYINRLYCSACPSFTVRKFILSLAMSKLYSDDDKDAAHYSKETFRYGLKMLIFIVL